MPQFEAQSSQFGLISGIRRPHSDMVLASAPAGMFAPAARKGRLYIVAEADQEAARGHDACQLVIQTIRRLFYEDNSYSVTSSLRKAIVAANKALYDKNFSASPQKRAVVGVTCAVLKGGDLYIAQVRPAQAYVLAGTKLRALPPLPGGAALQFQLSALGASLTADPEFFRAALHPGDTLLMCSSNLAALIEQPAALPVLRAPTVADVAEGLATLCANHQLSEAHGLVVMLRPAISPAAQAEPLSRTGITEHGRAALRRVVGWASRASGDAALLVRGVSPRAQRQRATARLERSRREQEQLAALPEEPPYSASPPPAARPLELGASLGERVDNERASRRTRLGAAPLREHEDAPPPPSRLLGEGEPFAQPGGERWIDLSDTPGMATLGRSYGQRGADAPAPTLGQRLTQPLHQIADTLSGMSRRRKLRRLPPRALPRRGGGLSYRRQAPPFPWQWLALLVLVIAAAILYGLNLSREIAQRRADDTLTRAATAVAALRGANEQSAQQLLDSAAIALASVRDTGTITATTENRQRYLELVREYERTQAAIQKLTYFDDLELVAQHPAPAGLFSTVVVPPPAQGITNTQVFAQIYMLDTNAGVLYRMPRNGGPIEPLLRPQDAVGPLVVGKVKAQAWREDTIVAVAQSGDAGPFTFYFRTGEGWGYNTLAGSETWGRVNERFRALNYGGNLYVWGGGASSDQVQKYTSGSYGQFPEPWIKDTGGQNTANSLDMAIDGNIYLLRPDGRILIFSGGAFLREIVVEGLNPPLVTPAGMFVTGDLESGTIFLIDFNQRIIEIDKRSGAVIQQVRARPDSPFQLEQMTSLFVDAAGARPVLYLVNGGQILRATLPDRPRPLATPVATPPAAPTPTAAS